MTVESSIARGKLGSAHARSSASATDVADPVELNGVLWKELQAVKPELTRDTAAPPPLEEIYNRIGRPGQQEPLSAICLSGGGIRSATFNLGVLQHLAHLGILQRFDYLSSVSGGGYIASWLQAWMHHDKRALDQLQEFSRPNAFEPEPQPIRNLREYSNYLTPKLGLFSADTWTAAAMVVRNMLLNWLVLLPALAAVVAIPWLFLAAVENNDLFRRIDGTFVALATLTELDRQHPGVPVAPLLSALPYEQGTSAPLRRTRRARRRVAVHRRARHEPVGSHQASCIRLAISWSPGPSPAVWCIVNPLLGWTMIELGWFTPKNLPMPHTPPNEKVKKVRRRYEFWGLLASGAITSTLLVGVIVYWMAAAVFVARLVCRARPADPALPVPARAHSVCRSRERKRKPVRRGKTGNDQRRGPRVVGAHVRMGAARCGSVGRDHRRSACSVGLWLGRERFQVRACSDRCVGRAVRPRDGPCRQSRPHDPATLPRTGRCYAE